MSKRFAVLLIAMALLLSSCAQSEQSEPAATLTQATLEPDEDAPETRALARCVAESRQSTPDPTMQAILPPIDSSDWVKGPEDAYVTFIEYGDFQ
jgi:hypothetical protein